MMHTNGQKVNIARSGEKIRQHYQLVLCRQDLVTEAAVGEDDRQCPERWLIPLQAAARGLLLRRQLRERRLFFSRHTAHIVRIQVGSTLHCQNFSQCMSQLAPASTAGASVSSICSQAVPNHDRPGGEVCLYLCAVHLRQSQLTEGLVV